MRAQRWALVLLCLSALAVAVPALFAPADFFRSFPLGRGWVQALPPYNEHLTRDVGGLYLGVAVLFGGAAVISASVMGPARPGQVWSAPRARSSVRRNDRGSGSRSSGSSGFAAGAGAGVSA